MAKQKFIVVSSFRNLEPGDGKVFAKGSFLDLDFEIKREADTIALLNKYGRIGVADKKNVDAINAELKAEAEAERRWEELPAQLKAETEAERRRGPSAQRAGLAA